STYYHGTSKTFNLPVYADASASANIIVRVSGSVVPEDASTWLRATSPNRIIFNGSYNLYQNQTIEITYYATSGVTTLLQSKVDAQNSVNTMCTCASGSKCNLKPILNNASAIVNYECVHPDTSSSEPPANQTVFVSSKNVP